MREDNINIDSEEKNDSYESQNNINKISNYTIENMTKQTYNILSNLPKNKYE